MPAARFEDLVVWRKAHEFVTAIYALTHRFPQDELYDLVSQTRRAAISIPANIAEGFRKFSKPGKARYLNIARPSLEECRCYLILAEDLNYCRTDNLTRQLEEVSKPLTSYRNKILNS